MSPSRTTRDYALFDGSSNRQTNRNLDDELGNNGGGVVGANAPRIVYGESVIVLMESATAKDLLLCGAEAGLGKLCFRTNCTTVAHRTRRPVDSFESGIYIRCGSHESGNSYDKVYAAPVGSIGLMDYHMDSILSLEHTTPTAWTSRFATWGMSTSEVQEAETIARRTAARAAQTPGKPKRPVVSLVDSTTYEILDVDWNKSGLETYENLWALDSAERDEIELPTTFKAGNLISAIGNSVKSLIERVETIWKRVEVADQWVEEVVETTNLRVSEMEHNIGQADFSEYAGTSLWNSISLLSDGLKTVEDQGDAMEAELTTMFEATLKMRDGFEFQMEAMERRLSALEEGDNQGTDSAELVARIRDLEQLRVGDRIRLEGLESRVDTGTNRYELNSSVSLSSDVDVLAFLDNEYREDDFEFGGFADVYNVLLRLDDNINETNNLQAILKVRRDLKHLNLSEGEAMAIHTHSGLLPPIFGGKRTTSSEIGSLPAYVKWRNKSNMTGLAYDMEKNLPMVERDIKAVIQLHYEGDLAIMATKMLDVSISFISRFILWVDDTQSVLVAGGNQTSDVWWILTRVMRAIFEDYFAPARATPTRTRYRTHNHQASVILWGTIKTHVAAVSINERGIKDHPIVVGAYAQWLVSHSGRREAGEALKEAAKAIAIAAELKVSIGSQKGLLAELKTRVEAVKKVADKALAKSG